MMMQEPLISQQPSARAIRTSQVFPVHCRAIYVRNRGTDIVYIDNEPVDPGDVYHHTADWNRILNYRMNIQFEGAAGKTQEVWIRQLSDVGNFPENQ